MLSKELHRVNPIPQWLTALRPAVAVWLRPLHSESGDEEVKGSLPATRVASYTLHLGVIEVAVLLLLLGFRGHASASAGVGVTLVNSVATTAVTCVAIFIFILLLGAPLAYTQGTAALACALAVISFGPTCLSSDSGNVSVTSFLKMLARYISNLLCGTHEINSLNERG
jgi:hypothetical protein